MNAETYEALKRIIKRAGYLSLFDDEFENNDIDKVGSWIDEVAKEYK